MHELEIEGADKLLQLQQEDAFTTEVFILIRDHKLTLMAVPSDVDRKTKVWIASFDLDQPLLEGLKKLFFDHPILSLPYQATHLYIDEGGYTIIPKDLNDSATPQSWIGLNQSLEGKQVLSQPVPAEHMILHYTIPLELYHFCQRSFSIPTYNHTLYPLILSATRISRQREPQLIMLRIGKSEMDMIYVADGIIQLVNRYNISSELDIIYYLTGVWRQYYLSSESVPLYIYDCASGYIHTAFVDQLKEKIRRVEVNNYPELICSAEALKKYENALEPEFIFHLLCG